MSKEINIKKKELRKKILYHEEKIKKGNFILGNISSYQQIALLKAELKGINWTLKQIK